MSDVKNLWVLKQPLPIPYEIDKSYSVHLDLETYFEPLDVESLTTQLEDILQNFWQDEDQDLDDSVAEVLELIGITKEQK